MRNGLIHWRLNRLRFCRRLLRACLRRWHRRGRFRLNLYFGVLLNYGRANRCRRCRSRRSLRLNCRASSRLLPRLLLSRSSRYLLSRSSLLALSRLPFSRLLSRLVRRRIFCWLLNRPFCRLLSWFWSYNWSCHGRGRSFRLFRCLVYRCSDWI